MRTAALRDELAGLGFHESGFGRRRLYLASEIAAYAASVNHHLIADRFAVQSAFGNRRSAFALTVAGLPPMFVRRYRRGGLMRFLVAELYAGTVPRPLHELRVTAAAHRRGLPVVEPMGAMVEAAGPCLYRGWLLTRALHGTTLWELLLSAPQPQARRQALHQARAAIDRLHEGGLYHADLNLHNLFVYSDEQRPGVVVLDLDKARLYPGALPARIRRNNFSRLARSARRLAAAGPSLADDERAILGIGPI